MLKNLIEKVEQKSLSLYDMLLTMISIIIGLITLYNSISNNYQYNEMISFYSQLFIFVSIIVVGIYFIKKFIGPPGNEKFNELNPLEKGPVGRKKEIHLLLNFLKSKSDTKNLLILTGDSGCGKTSFITAGIIPNPKLKEIDNILIRFEQYEDYHESLQKEIKEALQQQFSL